MTLAIKERLGYDGFHNLVFLRGGRRQRSN